MARNGPYRKDYISRTEVMRTSNSIHARRNTELARSNDLRADFLAFSKQRNANYEARLLKSDRRQAIRHGLGTVDKFLTKNFLVICFVAIVFCTVVLVPSVPAQPDTLFANVESAEMAGQAYLDYIPLRVNPNNTNSPLFPRFNSFIQAFRIWNDAFHLEIPTIAVLPNSDALDFPEWLDWLEPVVYEITLIPNIIIHFLNIILEGINFVISIFGTFRILVFGY